MKRLRYSLLVLIAFAFMVFGAQSVMAEEGTLDNVLKWRYENGTMTVFPLSPKAATVITIPAAINGIPVTAIGGFRDCYNLTSITIPDSVTTIQSCAFVECHSLRSITIPSSVKIIANNVFEYCISLESVTIPNSVTTIANEAFYDCRSLKGITIPDSVTTIDYEAFSDCRSLTSVTIPDSVTKIGDRTFWNCNSLTRATIPGSVTEIGKEAFGYYYDVDSQQLKKVSGFTIYGDFGTAAESYASENGFTFVGNPDDIGNAVKISSLEKEKYIYSGSENKPAVTLEYCGKYDGLKEGTDYTISYSNNVNAGTATVTVSGINHFNGSISKEFTIEPAELSVKIKPDKEKYEYTGAEIKPSVQVTKTSDNQLLTEGTDYTVSYSNNVNEGTGTVTVTGINNYTGTTSISFSIVKASQSGTEKQKETAKEKITITTKPSSVKAKVKKNKVTVSWKKIKKNKAGKKLLKQTKSIQVQYSTDKKFKKGVTTKNVGKSKTKVTLKLKRKTTYYIRVSYKGDNGYSKWSSVKKVKTK